MKPTKTIIALVEDCPMQREVISYLLTKNPSFEVSAYQRPEDLEQAVKPDLVIADHCVGDNGTARDFCKAFKDIPFIIYSGQQDISTAVELIREGACAYIEKSPEALNVLITTVEEIANHHSESEELEQLKKKSRKTATELGLVALGIVTTLGILFL